MQEMHLTMVWNLLHARRQRSEIVSMDMTNCPSFSWTSSSFSVQAPCF